MNQTPNSSRIHIGFFGKRNVGKSTIVNAITNQEVSVVSDVKGTTTDPVQKAMELLPLGPVLIIDTPGYDDEGKLGELRIKKTRQVLNKTDIAILVVDATEGKTESDKEFIKIFEEKQIKYIVVYNKSDLLNNIPKTVENEIYVSAINNSNIYELKELVAHKMSNEIFENPVVSDLIKEQDLVVLVVPIDSAAPKGRLILPQQQTIRDILDAGAICVVTKENQLENTLANFAKTPELVITDSQVFKEVSKVVPNDILLTSFSILMARKKGLLDMAVNGARAIDKLNDKDIVLIAEGCTHHKQCDDIGSVKIPKWVKEYTGKDICFEFSSGMDFPDDLSKYSLIIHCGGCMLNDREVKYRMKCALDQNVPITNYGTAIAYTKGILERSIKIFPQFDKNK